MSTPWEEQLSGDGRLYFYHRETGQSSWKIPDDATTPPSSCWRKFKNHQGRAYYHNTATKETTWKRPADYSRHSEASQDLAVVRRNFFKMMSSSIQKNLNPKESPTPSLYTIKETSVRFDTDPRLICATQKQRERFIDEWLILERERRVVLERKLVKEAQNGLRDKMFEMIEAKTLTVNSKWDSILPFFRLNKDWRTLLNFDRLKVFVEVKKILHDECMAELALRREALMKIEGERRLRFIGALNRLFDQIEKPLNFLSWADMESEITAWSEYAELTKNTHGSTPSDLFYSVLEKRVGAVAEIGCEKIARFLTEAGLSVEEQRWVFAVHRGRVGVEGKRRALLRLMKGRAELAECPPFEVAVRAFGATRAAQEVGGEGEQRAVYERFCEWSRRRAACEPGEIIEGDSDWEDINPAIDGENESSK
jgi:pre-mRNA-processing factor 40